MFTGIIEEIGKIQKITSNELTITCNKVLEGLNVGDSVAVNGVCLTVTNFDLQSFTANLSQETLRITSFKHLKNSTIVNLERAMPANGRFGGHIVSGHIDGTGEILSIIANNEFYNFKIKLPEKLSNYIIQKGSITVDGISLTIAKIDDNIIELAIIPHTFENTNLKTLKTGNIVNIEIDVIAKYIEKFLSSSDNKSRINLEFLQEHGF